MLVKFYKPKNTALYQIVEILNIAHGTSDPIDSYIEKAEYADTGVLLTDDECAQLGDQIADKIYEDFAEQQQCRAEYLAEGMER